MKVAVVGTGYVGLVSGVCLASKGHDVVCVDIDAGKVEQINAGEPPIYENGLEALLKQVVGTRLRATTDLATSVVEADATLIAVGTPFDGQRIDLTYIKTAARLIGEALKGRDAYHLVIVKSTVVPGTTDGVVLPIVEEASGKKAGRDFGVAMNPEFLREGDAVSDFMSPDRIVLGGIDARSIDTLEGLYDAFPHTDKVRTSTRTAEMIKYTANSLLATMISFSNEIANLCATAGDIDVQEVMRGVHLDKRLSPIIDGNRIVPGFTTYIEAGCGFGGSCFPKDVKALSAHGTELGLPMHLLDAVLKVNASQPERMITLLRKHHPDLRDVPVAVLGLAFKPGTDDIRESPSLPVVRELLRTGARVRAYDPIAEREARKAFGDVPITYADSVESCVQDARAVLIMTRWDEFKVLPDLLRRQTQHPVVIDGRRMLDRDSVSLYEGIGLSLSNAS